jgi:hypothetical protein
MGALRRRQLVFPVAVTHPATPTVGMPVRCGTLVGVAVTDEGQGGNAPTETTVDFRPGVWLMQVSGVDGSGAAAVALFDALYYVDADAPVLNKKTSGTLFGYALGTVTSGGTGTIPVMKKGI